MEEKKSSDDYWFLEQDGLLESEFSETVPIFDLQTVNWGCRPKPRLNVVVCLETFKKAVLHLEEIEGSTKVVQEIKDAISVIEKKIKEL